MAIAPALYRGSISARGGTSRRRCVGLTPRGFVPAGSRGQRSARSPGFTFIEIVLVIVILGIFFAMAAPNLDGFTPKYRLRTAARRIATQVESQRVQAVSKGVWLGIRYVLDGEAGYYEVLQPPPADFPQEPVEERKSFGREKLPPGVWIDSVEVRGSAGPYTSGTIIIPFSPTGIHGSHTVTLRDARNAAWRMKFNSITGIVDFDYGEGAAFDDFEG
jgi:prepilin-type N-terminal cleavage/methylation domain-containing protein